MVPCSDGSDGYRMVLCSDGYRMVRCSDGYRIVLCSDGYPMQDVVMQWKGGSSLEAVHGVENVEIPQFTLVKHRIISTVETLATGRLIL